MSNMSPDRDIESQQTVLPIAASNPSRDRWRWTFLVLQACRILTSIADEAKKRGSLAVAAIPSSTHCSKIDANLEPIAIEEVSNTSPQVSVNVPNDGSNDPAVRNNQMVSDADLQRANICQMVKSRDLESLKGFGGTKSIAVALNTDLDKGIPGDKEDLYCRCISSTFSEAQDPAKGFFQLLLKSCNNYIVFLLLISAVMSIGFGIKEEGLRTGWYEGVVIIVAIIILVVISPFYDFWHEILKLSKKQKPSEKRQIVIDVLRGGNSQKISISDVVNGDIACLRRGDKVPGDGLFISGEFLKLDDGLATVNEQNPFLYYGAKVVKGHGRMLVTSVGEDTAWGETMFNQVTQAPGKNILPVQLDKLNFWTQIVGLSMSIFILVVVFLRFMLGMEKHDSGIPEIKGKPTPSKVIMDAVMRIVTKPNGKVSTLTTSLAMLVVGMVEGVPFIISRAILYWNTKALSDKAFAKEPLACVSMCSVTTICTGKTGGLTLNPQEVDVCLIGEEVIHDDSVINADVLEALSNGIGTPVLGLLNSTEDPLLSWARLKLGIELESLRQSCTIVNAKELHSREERSGVLVRKNKNQESHMCLYWKGPAKKILPMCSFYYDSKGAVKDMDGQKRLFFEKNVEQMQSKQLTMMAFAYKQVDTPTFEENRLILIGMLGLKHMSRIETTKAANACINAGIKIILISEDNVEMLESMGLQCELWNNSDTLVLAGEEFRNCTHEKRLDMVEKISVIGSSLPSDKLLLVQCLKQKGHTVAMVGVSTNETPALREADLGIAMGTLSTELARESADIIVLDGSFSSLVTIMSCGRCAYDNIRKYIQLEVTTVVAGLLINAIMTIANGDNPITAIQWFWANLMVSVLGGLALLTEPPSEKLMDRQPMRKTDPFITMTMWRNIITQAFLQAAILVSFQYKSKSMCINKEVSETMIFNSFVLCQVFNQFNAREPTMKNIFKGVHKNPLFWVAVSSTVVLQMAFIEIAHIWVGDAKLNFEQWVISFVIGMISLAIDLAAKVISNFILYWLKR